MKTTHPDDRTRQARGAPPRPGTDRRTDAPTASSTLRPAGHRASPGGLVARIGAPPLVALAAGLALLILVCCALFVPGFVRPANADTTSSTEQAPPDQPTQTTQPAQPVPVEPSAGRALATLPWGSADGQVGLAKPTEGLTRGPEALAVAPDGRIAVLDSVNSRLVLLAADGSFAKAIPLSLTLPRFLAVDDRLLYVLDADNDRQVACYDWQGGLVRSAPIPALDDVVTGFFATADGPCIEVAHDAVSLVEFKGIGSEKSATVGLRSVPGRPLDQDLGKSAKLTFKPKDGMKVKSFKVDKATLKGTQTRMAAPKLAPGKAVEHLVSIDGDGHGGLIIGARLVRAKNESADAPSLLVGRLAADQTGSAPVLTDTLTLSDCPFAYVGQPYVVAPDGRIFQPVPSETGYTIFIYTLPGAAGTTAPPAAATLEVQP